MSNNLHWNAKTGRMEEGLGLPSEYEPLIEEQIRIAEAMLQGHDTGTIADELRERIASLKAQLESVVAHRK